MRDPSPQATRAFTLIDLLLVLGIIAVLAMIVVVETHTHKLSSWFVMSPAR
jgi:competence protein ComGC